MKPVKFILDLLYPPKCTFCEKLLKDEENYLCSKCTALLPKLSAYQSRRDIKHIRQCVFPFKYKDEVRESLVRYKFYGLAAYGPIYADFIAKSIDENEISCDIISWVPIHRKRYRERGYDQSKLIAKALAKKLGVPCRKLLIKGANNKRQSSIDDREERKRNVSGVYRLATKDALVGKRILLVDDIVTSGSTISECAAVLKGAGCTEIYAAAVASAAP